ncbi:uncharacterized protein LOC132552610 isoform X1 [Ylistrum balloti]|uniref:uncharacterized protein LOC132552610 isoform X1 n=1 Tax=Ylistrum balloti TaxID=509963 RepID=UPI002905ACE0|nr:uncharacterized protein LOC132552610 isoform X1 [Ylistrum balloti]
MEDSRKRSGISYSRLRHQYSSGPSAKESTKSGRSRKNTAANRVCNQSIFDLQYCDIQNDSSPHSHLKYGFLDEEDFEEFKLDLKNFSHLKEELLEDFSLFKSDNKPKLLTTAETRKSSHTANDPLMEFLNSDEHFQEFERVFETFKSNRFSDSLDKLRWSLNRYGDEEEEEEEPNNEEIDDKCDVFEEELDDSQIEDSFTEFFDHDEDFMAFEREFQNLKKVKRRSKVLQRINRNSGCDIVQELKAFCDNDPSLKYDVSPGEERVWNSGGEWDYIFNKLKNDNHVLLPPSASGSLRTCTSIKEDSIADFDTGFYCSAKNQDLDTCSTLTDLSNLENDCQFTCHQKCGPLVRLGCKASPVDEGLPPDPNSVETSLTDPPDQPTTTDTGSEATNEKDETDSGYRSGTIPDEKLPRKRSQATLNREELKRKIEEYNSVFPAANVALKEEKDEAFQGFIKVVLNLIRPICMSLGARPPSIYEMLTKEHIVEQNTLTVSFYMPRDTCKSIHVTSDTTATDVISLLLKKFHILDHPRKFALYEQEHSPKGKIVKLRRLPGSENLLSTCVHWEKERLLCTRLVLQENETGEIVWENFSKPELENFLLVLDREEKEYISQLQYKYHVMKRIIHQRFKELRKERRKSALMEKQASKES